MNFFQKEECNSQNYCEYIKLNGLDSEKISGLKMEDRYDVYKLILEEEIAKVKNDWKSKFGNEEFPAIRQTTRNKYLVNMRDDVERYSTPNKGMVLGILEKYIIYCDYANEKRPIKNWRCYTMGLIKVADRVVELFDRAFSRK